MLLAPDNTTTQYRQTASPRVTNAQPQPQQPQQLHQQAQQQQPAQPRDRSRPASASVSHRPAPQKRQEPVAAAYIPPPGAAPAAPAHRAPPAPVPSLAKGTSGGISASSRREAHAPIPAERQQVVARVLKILKTRTRAKAAVRPIFRAMDEDRYGGISHEEFITHLRRWGLREPAHQLRWVAEAIDAEGEGCINYDSFSRAMVANEMEDGMMKPELKAALEVVHREVAPRTHRPEYEDRGPAPFPAPPSSLRGGAAALSSRYAWSEWGGVRKAEVPEAPGAAAPGHRPPPRDAAASAAGAKRVQERAEARQRHKVQQVLDTLRRQVEMHGSVAAAFRKLEVSGDSKISKDEMIRALKQRFNIEMSADTAQRVVREFDIDGDGEIEYREFVQRLLGKFDIDGAAGGSRDGARGGGGAHVEMAADAADRRVQLKAQAGGELDLPRRAAAAASMGVMKQRLQTKYANLRDAFRSIDVDSDNTLSYTEFGGLVSEWLPELDSSKVHDVCRMLDADGDGMIDFEEFSSVMAAAGDDMKKSTAGLVRAREQKALQNMVRSKGRFGATPSFSYGVQAKELVHSFPGAAGYITEAQRFAPSVSHQLVPDWQIADAAKRAQRTVTRREQMRFHTQRQEAIAAARQRSAELLHDGRMNSLLDQKERYLTSVARENNAKLRPQATFRHTQPPGNPTALQQLGTPRGGA